MHTIHRLCRGCISQNLPQVRVSRGDDGFGFTICCDAPVRVQAVEPGGPAHAAGLQQGDSVLQLNSLPVETWQCVDLAHAIRSCSSQIVLVVWRGLPELRPHSQTTGRKLLPHPAHSKHGRRWGQGSGVRSSLGALGYLWRDRKDQQVQQDQQDYSPRSATMKGTHVTSSHGDNYIILSHVDPGGQLLQSVYQDREGADGQLYQTQPSRGQHLQPDPRPGSSRRPFTSTLPPPISTSSNHPGNYGNYQNCTIVQSHVPCSYGPYSSPAPRTLIFPVFVQPLDLCSPDRTLLMSEEMMLHQANLLPARVTVLIYSDLLLFTREDEAGRCNVLQSPVYLNTLQLREVSSAPLQIHFLSGSLWTSLQLVTTETGHPHQLSDLPSDFGLLSLCRPCSPLPPLCDSLKASSPYSPSSHLFSLPLNTTFSPPSKTFPTPPTLLPHSPPTCSSINSPVWKDKGGEERQQGEGESASETSEDTGAPPPFILKESDGKVELSFRPAVLRRSLSEGSLLQEPRSTRFLSESTIHGISPHTTPDPHRPSTHTLTKQLTRKGGSLHQMLLLLNDTKDAEFGDFELRTKTKSLAADVRNHLLFLQQRKNSSCFHGNSLEKALRNSRPCTRVVLRWAESLEALLTNQYGLAVFRHFLRSEFSEENLDFWLAVETFKRTRPLSKMATRAVKIYEEFISTSAERQVNVDLSVRESTSQGLRLGVNPTSFQGAQDQIFGLMECDSYPRFLRSRLYTQLANQGAQTESAPRA
ncbi:hypothetical protein PBY51_004657 [Eleginops maclovinus]|uniref:Regulator of G-protein signaling 3-like n=1 Tax=Eleginops maclovinus TaxID=56733 RepID=A0AAN8ATL1_ELEMC|nr:hypothetical protein PBY51_004657 [Eleginops maclovinus]